MYCFNILLVRKGIVRSSLKRKVSGSPTPAPRFYAYFLHQNWRCSIRLCYITFPHSYMKWSFPIWNIVVPPSEMLGRRHRCRPSSLGMGALEPHEAEHYSPLQWFLAPPAGRSDLNIQRHVGVDVHRGSTNTRHFDLLRSGFALFGPIRLSSSSRNRGRGTLSPILADPSPATGFPVRFLSPSKELSSVDFRGADNLGFDLFLKIVETPSSHNAMWQRCHFGFLPRMTLCHPKRFSPPADTSVRLWTNTVIATTNGGNRAAHHGLPRPPVRGLSQKPLL